MSGKTSTYPAAFMYAVTQHECSLHRWLDQHLPPGVAGNADEPFLHEQSMRSRALRRGSSAVHVGIRSHCPNGGQASSS